MATNNSPKAALRPALARYKDKPRPTLSENPAGIPPPVPVIEGILDTPPMMNEAAEQDSKNVDRVGELDTTTPANATQEIPEQVPFNSQIRFQTYLRIKQAQFYDRVKIKDLTDEALNYYLDQFEGANTPLPPKVLQEVLNQGKIKGYKKRGK
ncbi:hypothetical protein [Hymenobacter crusticola]|uniref:Uncharacterized protein n=1 Tax=Hymenobacter crusticola TaxID=1770526 RepID=A0A243W808_9BACT|nr:hypothetical protein [Hymenobacter crusticola]OUJ68939.1 hypothetical protein BXP70_27230 [Hymenobacter crusticola]